MRLNVGCGPIRVDGEIGVDRYPTDACDVRGDLLALPFPDGSAEFVRLDHVLEHQPQRVAVAVLLETRRVLRSGGTLRVGVPDLAALCALYAGVDSLRDKALLLRNLYGSQIHEGEYHRSGWERETLRDVLHWVGFERVSVTDDPDRDEGACLIAEGVKP